MKKTLLALIVGIFGAVAMPNSNHASAQYYDPCTGGTSPYEYGCDDPMYYYDDDGDGVVNGTDSCISQAGPSSNNGCPTSPPVTMSSYTPPQPSDPDIAEWEDAFVGWCIEDGYDVEECMMAGEAFARALDLYLNGGDRATAKDPRVNYPIYYPGGSKNTVPNPTPSSRGTVEPGAVPVPVPQKPTRGPSTYYPATTEPAPSSSGWYRGEDGMWYGPNGEQCLHEGCC